MNRCLTIRSASTVASGRGFATAVLPLCGCELVGIDWSCGRICARGSMDRPRMAVVSDSLESDCIESEEEPKARVVVDDVKDARRRKIDEGFSFESLHARLEGCYLCK